MINFRGGIRSFSKRLFEPVDAASIYAFRLMFGLVMFWEVWRFVGSDWIGEYYVDRPFLFKYYGFSWVKAWPGDGMYIHFAVVGVLALCMAFGFLYRLAAWLFFLGFSYWFLLDQSRYLNHLYLVCLVSFLLACIPAHRGLSLDARLRSGLTSQTLPAWCLWLLRFQVCVVYFYAGVAKLNVDWLRLEPIRTWLARRNDYPLIGPFLETEVAAAFFGYGGLVFDLAIAPLLLWKRTRAWAFVVCIFFHATNKMLFNIGIFPFLAIALTTVMLSPDWPRRLKLFVKPYPANSPSRAVAAPTGFVRGMVVAFLAIYISIQLLFPLRHFLYPGYVSWTEEGHRFAWHMKLREKRAMARFFATDPRTGETQEVDTTQWLCKEQRKRVGRFSDMSLQFAHFLADELGEGDGRLEIRVQSIARVNGRMSQLIFDPNVDLAAEKRSLAHAEWILPLRYDLPAVD